MKPIVMPKQTWIPTPADRFQDIRPCDGLNQGANPLDIGPGQVTSILNMRPLHYPTIEVREGFTQVGGTHAGHYTTHLRRYNGVIVKGDKYGVYKQNNVTWDIIIDSTLAERYWEAAMYDNNLYLADGTSKVQKYNGTSVSTMADSPNNSRHITLHANRLFLVADDEPNVIRWSKYETPEVFTVFLQDDSDPGFQPINSNTGEDIECIYTYRNRVMIFKRHSIHQLLGEKGYDFEIMDISNHVGCIAARTPIEINGRLYFLGHSGVFVFDGGSVPSAPISDPVRGYIDSINWNQLNQCVSGTDGRMLFLTLVTGANTTPNVTLMYDPDKKSWWVHDHIATAFLEDGENWYIGTANGKVFNMDDGENDAGTAIAYEVVTKPIVRGNWHIKKRLNRVKVVADIPAGATFNVYYSVSTDGEDWELIKQLAPTTDVKNTKIMLVGQRSEWFRIKVSGTGRVKIYAISYEVE